MLKSLKFAITFASTGRSFTAEHDFEAGLTMITGANEQGKSLRLEMISFALFGSKALRAVTAKYTSLKSTLVFVVRGNEYTISRTLSKATVSIGDTLLATGTSAVNQKVTEIFGYGLDVFNAAHCIQQGQIEALGAMRPAERKQMVDSVIGLTVLDSLIDFVHKSHTNFRQEADTLEQALVKPEKPAIPANYQHSAFLGEQLRKLKGLKTERDQLIGQISHEPPLPMWPLASANLPTLEELELLIDRRRDIKASLDVFQVRYDAIPEAVYTTEQLDKIEVDIVLYEAWVAYKHLLPACQPPEPSMPQARIDGQRKYIQEYAIWEASIERWNRHKIECPNCHHVWAEDTSAPTVADLEEPEYTKADLDDYQHRIKAWANVPAPVAEQPMPPFGMHAAAWHREAIKHQPEKQNFLVQIDILKTALAEMPDVTEQLKERHAFDRSTARAEAAQAEYDEFQKRKKEVSLRINELAYVEAELGDIYDRVNHAMIYEVALTTFEKAVIHYDELFAKVTVAKTRSDNYKKAKGALLALKSMVKTYLIPSLNTVASQLLSQMTGGQRTLIQVNEDFDVKVDGQDIDELSGSAKAVANLTIRLGLGMVLTHKVFGVFMGDELDAAMDIDRAGYTAECLRGLTAKIPQVILVTHKRTEGLADTVIELGEAA